MLSFTALVIALSCTLGTQTTAMAADARERELIGVWQDISFMASGWSDTYQFFGDGTYVFNHSQMNCLKREIWHSGSWKIQGRHLRLTIANRKVIVGGKRGEDPVCGPTIIGGRGVTKNVNPPEVTTVYMGVIQYEMDDHPLASRQEMPSVKIGSTKYWRLHQDPKQYGP